MRLVFLDTVGLIALWDRSDQWHRQAADAYSALKTGPFAVVTSSYVLLECANAAVRRPYRPLLIELRNNLLVENLAIEPTPDEVVAAWAQFEHAKPGSAGVVDLISFQIMRRLGITDAFTNDRHFLAEGFTTLF